jgi:hypothetical protein
MSGSVGSGRYEVRYRFTREELRELGTKLAVMVQRIYDQKTAKAESAKAFAAEIESLENLTARVVRAINEGAETREVECSIWFNHPRQGVKTIRWQDAGEGAMEAPMTPAEMQSAFAFDDPNKTQ